MIHNGPAGTCFHLSQQCPDLHKGYYFSPTCLKYILSFLPPRPSTACKIFHLLWRVPRCSSPDGNTPGFYSIIILFNTFHISRSDFTMCQLLYWSPLTSPQIRCQLKSTTAHKISRARSFIASASPHGCARKKNKKTVRGSICVFWLPAADIVYRKKKRSHKIFSPHISLQRHHPFPPFTVYVRADLCAASFSRGRSCLVQTWHAPNNLIAVK